MKHGRKISLRLRNASGVSLIAPARWLSNTMAPARSGAEGRGFPDAYAELQGEGMAIVGVSFDAPDANAEFSRDEGFPFPLLSDRDKTLAIAVGAADSRSQWMARRVSYLVGPDGVVWVAYDTVDPRGHAAQVLTDVRARRAAPDQEQGGQSKDPD